MNDGVEKGPGEDPVFPVEALHIHQALPVDRRKGDGLAVLQAQTGLEGIASEALGFVGQADLLDCAEANLLDLAPVSTVRRSPSSAKLIGALYGPGLWE